MGVEPKILFGHVMHGRLFPKVNTFRYGIPYLYLPLGNLDKISIAHNRFGFLSFYNRDHGAKNGEDLNKWAHGVLSAYNINTQNKHFTLVCIPRVLGYVFNPISFFLCHDKNGNLRAVICEVHNTFGERHIYLCTHDDHRAIASTDILQAEKLFHVSPFLEREGHYTFRFDTLPEKFSVWIDYFHANGEKQLVTSLIGTLKPMNKKNLRIVFWRYPLITLKVITLIHYQALKLIIKGIYYIHKPKQKKQHISATKNIDK